MLSWRIERQREKIIKNDCCLFWITQWKIHIITSCLWLGDNCRWSASEYRKILPLQQPEFYLLLNLVRYLTCYFLLNFLLICVIINTESKQVYIFNIQSPTQTKTTDMQIKQKQHIQSMTVISNHITNIYINFSISVTLKH